MKINTHRFYRNREAVIKGAALFLLDAVLVMACMVGALWIRCDFRFNSIDPIFWESIQAYLWINVICTLLINAFCKLYTSLWRFASLEELKNALVAIILSSFIQFFGMRLLGLPVPRSYIFIYMMLLAICIIGPRFSYRFLRIAYLAVKAGGDDGGRRRGSRLHAGPGDEEQQASEPEGSVYH